MNEKKLKQMYEDRGYSKEKTDSAVTTIVLLEKHLEKSNNSLEECQVDDIKEYIASLLLVAEIEIDTLLAMARYFYLIDKNDIYIYFTKLLGGVGVIDNIKRRMIKYAGQKATDKVFDGFNYPPLGTPIEEVPKYTKELIARINDNLDPSIHHKVLAGNNHGIPAAAMEKEKEHYENASSLEEYLKGRHERNVAELQEYCDAKRVWFEQEITQPVVDYVKSNQEILSAVKKDDKLYVTKIPYDTVGFLNAENDARKNYYACHCPFARESILNDSEKISGKWCYCSAGFAKFPFEQLLGRELKVKVLKNALDGDGLCRFEIDLSED